MSKLKVISILHRLKTEINADLKKLGRVPTLAVILVDGDEASSIYSESIQKKSWELGINCEIVKLPSSVSQKELEGVLISAGNDSEIDGIMIQRPLPKSINIDSICSYLPAEKDVEGITNESLGKILSGDKAPEPCTAKAVYEIIKHYGLLQFGSKIALMGISTLVGKPLLNLLAYRGGVEITMIDINTPNPQKYTKQADLLVVAIGDPEAVTSDYLKEGAVVIDVGINQVCKNGEEVVVGDVDYEDCSRVASAITAVPGGVGRVTTLCIFKNLLFLCNEKKFSVL